VPESRPNILLLLTDQHRRDSLGCYGSPVCRTPNLDRVAAEGVRFEESFTNTAICTAVRATLLTGLEPHQHGMLANFERNVGYPWELPDGLVPFSHHLSQVGYRCGVVGKWHLGLRRGPEACGFEGLHFPGWDAPKTHPAYEAYLKEHSLPRWSVRDPIRGTFPNGKPSIALAGIYDGPLEGTYPYYLAELTIERLNEYARHRERTGQPFFLRTDFFGPHLPYYLPQLYADLYDPGLVEPTASMRETFAHKPRVHRWYSQHWAFDTYPWETWQKIVAMFWGYVTLIDEQIGRILATVDELGLAEDTALIFSADHAGFVGNHRLSDKGPMMYDDIYRIPMLARWPGHTPAGSGCQAMVTLMDLMPTFLDLAGARIPDHIAGRSLRPLLDGESPADWPEAVFLQFHGHHFPYPQRAIRTRTHKLVVNPPDINELYDLERDPHELENRIDDPAYAPVRRELMQQLYRHLVASGDNFYHWMTTMFEVE
jgi:arylsulfatase A-like enzyme